MSSPSPSPHSSSSSLSYNSSLLIIATLLVFVLLLTAAIHLLIRLFTPSSDPSSPSSTLNSTTTTTTTTTSETRPTRKSIADYLPLFTLSSLPPLSPPSNCTICLSKFEPHERLCILPACHHAFHSLCINTWIMSTPSCPLCRSSIQIQCIISESPLHHEIPPHNQEQQGIVEESSSMRMSSWLKEYVDRLAISASSSFNSMRFSTWGSRRFDGEASGGATTTSATPSSLEAGESFRSDSGYFAASYKWILTGEA